jgi:hypothetical protein
VVEFWNLDLVASIALKQKINIATRLSMADYPYLDLFFRMIGGHLTDFGALGKTLVAPQRNKSASSALHRSKEDNFLYQKLAHLIETELRYSVSWMGPTGGPHRRERVNVAIKDKILLGTGIEVNIF